MRRLAVLLLVAMLAVPAPVGAQSPSPTNFRICVELVIEGGGPFATPEQLVRSIEQGWVKVRAVDVACGGDAAPDEQPPGRSFGDGTWVVGADIQPGTYRTQTTGGCYWERLSGFGGADLIENDYIPEPGPAIVTIARTDKGFVSRGCGTWRPI